MYMLLVYVKLRNNLGKTAIGSVKGAAFMLLQVCCPAVTTQGLCTYYGGQM